MAGWKDKRKIMQRYDATAQGYNELYAEEQKAKYMAALKNLKVSDAKILDVGCGSGLFLQEVASQASIVVGIDISRKLLLKANQQAKAYPNAFALQADGDHLPFINGFFDVVFAFTVLQNMPQPAVALVEWKRVVKEKGSLVITALKKAFTLPAFMDLLEAAGFLVVSFVDDESLKCYVCVVVDTSKFASET